MPTLPELITRANNVLAVLEDLIEGDAAETPIAETGDAPVYDESTGTWIFAQLTANANGEYLGIYKLPLAILCAVLRNLNIVAFTPPAAPNSPARILPCGADPLTGWQNLPALVDLEDQEFNQFSIRSATPFEVRMQVSQEWCAVFLDGTGLGGFVTPAPLPGFPDTHGSYDSSDDAVVANWQGEYFWGVMRWQPSPAITITRIKAWGTVNPGISSPGQVIYVNDNEVESIVVSQSGNYQIEWTGQLSATSISIATTAFESGSARITRVEIEGIGVDPFTGRDCG
jgi:hypothetical protein